ncbi:MAG: hypothetical protein Ct9H300mP16_12770 [Pseudomonadota bacterium]|nr:MAG: hypothetical protein Ct9H300mP16_12770 [Pseudomonadota bacterium]
MREAVIVSTARTPIGERTAGHLTTPRVLTWVAIASNMLLLVRVLIPGKSTMW